MDPQMQGITPADLEAIVRTATDYIESWLDGDAERMRRSLHPALAKRAVDPEPTTDGWSLRHIDAEEMIEDARNGLGKGAPREREVTVLDAFRHIASVKIVSRPFIDYLHVARFGERWLIVNVLYDRRRQD